MTRTLHTAAALLLALPAAASAQSVTLLGVGGNPSPPAVFTPPAAGAKSTVFLDHFRADQAAAAGFTVTGSSGTDKDGFARSVNFRAARVYGDYAKGNNRHLKGVELGPEGTVNNPAAIRQAYNSSVARSNDYANQMRRAEGVLQDLTARHRLEGDPARRAAIELSYRTEAAKVASLAQARAAESSFQRDLRPGR